MSCLKHSGTGYTSCLKHSGTGYTSYLKHSGTGYRSCLKHSDTHTRTHPPVLSALYLVILFSLQINSRFLIPDFPLLVPALVLSLAPLHIMTFPFLSGRNPLWTLSHQTSFSKIYLPCFPFRPGNVSSSASSLCL